MMNSIKFLLLTMTLLLSACAPIVVQEVLPTATMVETSSPADSSPESTGSLTNTQWQLIPFGESSAETPLMEGSTLTLEFGTDDMVTGSGGCNSYSGTYQVTDNTLTLSGIVST